jgi:hypothetical protein
MVFDCAHGADLSNASQYRWYQVIYCFGSFLARTSTNLFHIPYLLMVAFPVLEVRGLGGFYKNEAWGYSGKITSLFSNFDSLPLMFGSKLKRREVIRGVVDAFGGCSVGICRLGKKIGCQQI